MPSTSLSFSPLLPLELLLEPPELPPHPATSSVSATPVTANFVLILRISVALPVAVLVDCGFREDQGRNVRCLIIRVAKNCATFYAGT